MIRTLPLLAILLAAGFAAAADRTDLLVADFEADAYPEGWTTTGTAFGNGPAKGKLPGQMAVDGFLGKGLVNSFLGGDDATGTLTSAEFQLERKYLNFLIGGGEHEGKTCINLLVNGKIVRTATGPNDKPGGTEHLDWHTWDIGEFAGKGATIQIVDEQKGDWGHINIDHIVQSDKKKQAEPARREIAVDQAYIHLPVKTGAPMRRMKFTVGKDIVREFDIELAVDGKPDFWAFADVAPFKGKALLVEAILPADSKALDSLKLTEDLPDAQKLYREKHRPLFHFTSRFGWLNDPNGLVYHNGEWHLFYQHNPFGVNWGNMHWGHAVSPDLVRWKELGIGLYPKKYGDMAFSGSAVLDKSNTSGWGTNTKPPLVLAFTSTGRGECIAHSNDNGRTWTEHDKNPVLKHAGRDPKLVWYEKGKHWVMAVYDEFQGKQWIAFHTSPDLKAWTFTSRIEGFFECPDLFEMAVGGEELKWVLYAANGKYMVGDFDGKTFKSDFKEKRQLWYGNFYAAQTFENAPRRNPRNTFEILPTERIQIGWANGVTFPGMPFNQQMTVPVELKLERDKESYRMTAMPVPELRTLGKEVESSTTTTKYETSSTDWNGVIPLFPSVELRTGFRSTLGDAFDLECEIDLTSADVVGFKLRGTPLTYDVKKGILTCKNVSAPVKPEGKMLRLRVLVDRGSIEVFADGGRVAMAIAAIPPEQATELEVLGTGGDVKVKDLIVRRLKSAWEK